MDKNRIFAIAVAGCVLAGAGAGAPALGDGITVSRADCKRIARYAPSADVEYKPGVDARGRKVAPADVGGGSQIKIPDEITIPIGIDLDEKYGLGADGKYTGEATIGTVKVRGGRVYYDGKPIDEGDQAAIAAACKKTYGND
jgi:hypothetical protein